MDKLLFTHLTDSLNYPPKYRAKLSILHGDIVNYVQSNYSGSFKDRKRIVDTLNTISYLILNEDTIPRSWNPKDPLVGLDFIDDEICKFKLSDLYLSERYIVWDMDSQVYTIDADTVETSESADEIKPVPDVAVPRVTKDLENPTPKEHLYIKPPTVPRFDYSKVFKSGIVGDTRYTVYASEPKVPTIQNQISATTNIDDFSSSDLLKLFPNRFIPTRSPSMYEPVEGLELHPILGLILPISGFTRDQLIDNLVKYPHLFKLQRVVPDGTVSFYGMIELEDTLFNISDVWNSLDESSVIPYNADFVKEYVVRRYLLERDVLGIQHKYPLFGTLDPFLTLFTTINQYRDLGYIDPVDIARQCVLSRVSYKKSRNPVLQRLSDV